MTTAYIGTIVNTINVSFQLIINNKATLPMIVITFLTRNVKLFDIADFA